MSDLIDRAKTWLDHDPDPATCAELSAIIDRAKGGDAAALEDLDSRFSGPLTFGTAGLRGAVAAGESRMNVALVTRADRRRGAVPARHGRPGRQGRRRLRCAARFVRLHGRHARGARRGGPEGAGAAQATAHSRHRLRRPGAGLRRGNHGHRIAQPAGRQRLQGLSRRSRLRRGREGVCRSCRPPTPRSPPGSMPRPRRTRCRAPPAASIRSIRLRSTRSSSGWRRGAPRPSRRRFASCSPLCTASADRPRTGSASQPTSPTSTPCRSRRKPDPVPDRVVSNPEEPGALDLALDLARAERADVIVAVDPDADRCSVAIPSVTGRGANSPATRSAPYSASRPAGRRHREGDTLANSIVSSRLLFRIAAAHGLKHATTLTGFKWIARTPGIRFGYEEAIGYCHRPGSRARQGRDQRDGPGRHLVEDLARDGRTIEDLLDDLARPTACTPPRC